MYILSNNNVFKDVRCIASPHCDNRPDQDDVSLLVIHNISLPPGQFGTGDIADLFMGKLDVTKDPYFEIIQSLRVSSHLLISREGEVTQFVPFDKRAWHAGVSSFEGREDCNDYAIGIELEGCDDVPYEAVQYQVLADVSKALLNNYPKITRDRIVGHKDIAPGRKTDPGPAFDWDHYYDLIGSDASD